MPRLNIQALITHLEEIDMNLGILWGECQNYDLLDGIERERRHIRKIIETLQNYLGLLGVAPGCRIR